MTRGEVWTGFGSIADHQSPMLMGHQFMPHNPQFRIALNGSSGSLMARSPRILTDSSRAIATPKLNHVIPQAIEHRSEQRQTQANDIHMAPLNPLHK